MMGLEIVAIKCFNFLCFVMAFGMMIKGTIKFWRDENASVISYQPFHGRSVDIYPSFSVCLNSGKTISGIGTPLNDPRYETELYNMTIMKEKYDMEPESAENEIRNYISFLMGESDSYGRNDLKVEYDDVSLNLNNHLELVGIASGDTILYEWKPHLRKKDPFKITYRHPTMKCFSFDISEGINDDMKKGTSLSTFAFSIDYNNSIFKEQSMLTMAYYLHYPNQLMRSNALEIVHLGKDVRTFRKQFWVDTIEVIRQRNTRHSPCNTENDKDDELITKKLIKNAQCTPPHWPVDDEFQRRCTSKNELLQVLTPSLETTNPRFLNQFKDDQPCDQIHAISFTFKEYALPTDCGDNITVVRRTKPNGAHISDRYQSEETKETNENIFKAFQEPRPRYDKNRTPSKHSPSKDMDMRNAERCSHPGIKNVEIHFKSSHYKEIKQIKDFCLESWIGNVGGYIGLFLGYAICQLPELISYVSAKLQ